LTDGVNHLAQWRLRVADLTREELHRLAKLGATSRLEELRREQAAIRRAFPDLFGGRARQSPSAGGGPAKRRRRRKGMSASARKAVSARMKKYWAARRREKKTK
jgi:hypothetical protein